MRRGELQGEPQGAAPEAIAPRKAAPLERRGHELGAAVVSTQRDDDCSQVVEGAGGESGFGEQRGCLLRRAGAAHNLDHLRGQKRERRAVREGEGRGMGAVSLSSARGRVASLVSGKPRTWSLSKTSKMPSLAITTNSSSGRSGIDDTSGSAVTVTPHTQGRLRRATMGGMDRARRLPRRAQLPAWHQVPTHPPDLPYPARLPACQVCTHRTA